MQFLQKSSNILPNVLRMEFYEVKKIIFNTDQQINKNSIRHQRGGPITDKTASINIRLIFDELGITFE